MSLIHLVIPDNALREAVTEQLTLAGYGVIEKHDFLVQAGGEGIVIADETALPDTALPQENRRILLLGNARTNEDAITESFPKPIRLGHLLARVKFYLETAPRLRDKPLSFGPYRLEPQQRRIVADNGNIIRLTEKETALLEYLGQSTAPVTREELLAAIWGYDGSIDTHTLETHIYQLRSKLNPGGEGPNLLLNEQGAYRLVSA